VCKHLSIFVGSGANFLKIHLECINFGNRKKIPKGMHGVLNGDVGLRKYPHNLMWIMPTEGCMNKKQKYTYSITSLFDVMLFFLFIH